MAYEFPEAKIVVGRYCLYQGFRQTSLPKMTRGRCVGKGVDLAPVPTPSHLANAVEFVQGDVLSGLPFPDGSFDIVHERFLVTGVSVRVERTALSLFRR